MKKLDCSIKLNTTVSEFENSNGKSKFISNLSISLGIDMSSIDYTISVDKDHLESIETK